MGDPLELPGLAVELCFLGVHHPHLRVQAFVGGAQRLGLFGIQIREEAVEHHALLLREGAR